MNVRMNNGHVAVKYKNDNCSSCSMTETIEEYDVKEKVAQLRIIKHDLASRLEPDGKLVRWGKGVDCVTTELAEQNAFGYLTALEQKGYNHHVRNCDDCQFYDDIAQSWRVELRKLRPDEYWKRRAIALPVRLYNTLKEDVHRFFSV